MPLQWELQPFIANPMRLPIFNRAARYVAAMPPAVAGAGGHVATFAVAAALVRGFQLPDPEAGQILADYNGRCLPPWSAADLAAKLRSARNSGRMAFGALLGDDQPHAPKHRAPTPAAPNDEAAKAAKRANWPALRRPTDGELLLVAVQRKLPLAAVDLARQIGTLRAATVDGHPCFVLTEGDHFAQAVRLDGLPFDLAGGPRKKTLPGSIASGFVGLRTLGDPVCPVLLVEGAVGFLEGLAAVLFADADGRPAGGWSVLAAIAAGSSFEKEPSKLPDFQGRRVRILPDADPGETGLQAAARWAAELEALGAVVDGAALPTGAKDLGDLLAEPEKHHAFLTQLFSI